MHSHFHAGNDGVCYNNADVRMVWFMDLKTIRISAKKQEILANMNIHCVEDLLTYYPFRYENIEAVPFAQWQKDDKIATAGIIVTRAHVIRLGGKRSITKFRCSIDHGCLNLNIMKPSRSSGNTMARIKLRHYNITSSHCRNNWE